MVTQLKRNTNCAKLFKFDFNPALASWTYTYCTKVHKPFFGLAHIAKKKFICPELTQALSGTEGDFFRQL